MLGARFNSRLRHAPRRSHRSHRNNFCQSKIQNLGVATFGDEDVCWLYVTVHDASSMSSIQSIGDFDAKRNYGFNIHWLPSDPRLQSDPIQKLHGKESVTVLLADRSEERRVGKECRSRW